MKRTLALFSSLLAVAAILIFWHAGDVAAVHAQTNPDWPQWANTPQHTGASSAVGQDPNQQLADITYDPFTAQEMAESGGDLLAHYQSPLIDGNTVFSEYKTGTYVSCHPPGSGHPFPCGPDAWSSQIWNERAFTWQGGSLVESWNFQSDWKPEPNGGFAGPSGWEPVFHAAVSKGFVFVPGASGSVYKLNESDGTQVAHFRPFGPVDDPNKFVSGPLTVDPSGNVYYNVIALHSKNPWATDVRGAWLVRVTPQGRVAKVSYSTLVPNAPTTCNGAPCGAQRPGLNVAPAVSADGRTIYTASRAHFFSDYGYMVAVNANLTPRWQTSLRDLIGLGIAGVIEDQSSSTPVVAPDGSILYGVVNAIDSRGDLLKLNSSGQYLTKYGFGWDITPAIYPHDSTYSVILKDNHYDTGGPYFITQLSADLVPEWQFKNTTIDGGHPNGYEWCVNAPAVDANGTVYVNSEDGSAYVIQQGGTLQGKLFLRRAVGAAYTPIAIGQDGKIYTENDGDMFVLGQ
ncbi:MAG: hypothetical protein LAN83_08915 [Acidobacteriia bacterium]|nr:hypothetical protein [Terriglobia bacterium]